VYEPPFSFTDLYGDTYDVKVTNSQWSVVEMLYQGSAKIVKSVPSSHWNSNEQPGGTQGAGQVTSTSA
jgi:hypothetical protein